MDPVLAIGVAIGVGTDQPCNDCRIKYFIICWADYDRLIDAKPRPCGLVHRNLLLGLTKCLHDFNAEPDMFMEFGHPPDDTGNQLAPVPGKPE
jgi:hypothetical protein